VDLAGPDIEIDVVNRAHATELQHYIPQRDDPAPCPGGQYVVQQRRPRDNGAITLQRIAALEVEQSRDPARRGKHDDQKQHRIEKGRPRSKRRRKFWQQR
jgi:hypothetical protein